jgi:hypothetical protein
MDCDGNHNDPWCFCFDHRGNSVPQYKQFNANSSDGGTGFKCCHNLHYNPDFLAFNYNGATFTSVKDYIDELNTYIDDKLCDYSVYLDQATNDFELENKFPELYYNAKADMEIFNVFYNKNNAVHSGAIANNSDLIPAINNNVVSCPNANYIPYYISFEPREFDKRRYLHVCYPENKPFPNLSFENEILYFYDNTGNDCKNNSCTTKFHAPIGLNAGSIAYNDRRKKLNSYEIAGIVIGVVFVLIGIIIGIYYYMKNNKN